MFQFNMEQLEQSDDFAADCRRLFAPEHGRRWKTAAAASLAIGRTTLYRMEKSGRFPRSTYISANRRVWFEDEIIAWQNAVDEFDPCRGRGKGRRHRASD